MASLISCWFPINWLCCVSCRSTWQRPGCSATTPATVSAVAAQSGKTRRVWWKDELWSWMHPHLRSPWRDSPGSVRSCHQPHSVRRAACVYSLHLFQLVSRLCCKTFQPQSVISAGDLIYWLFCAFSAFSSQQTCGLLLILCALVPENCIYNGWRV